MNDVKIDRIMEIAARMEAYFFRLTKNDEDLNAKDYVDSLCLPLAKVIWLYGIIDNKDKDVSIINDGIDDLINHVAESLPILINSIKKVKK